MSLSLKTIIFIFDNWKYLFSNGKMSLEDYNFLDEEILCYLMILISNICSSNPYLKDFFDKKMILSDEERKIFVENESNKQKVYNKIKKLKFPHYIIKKGKYSLGDKMPGFKDDTIINLKKKK